ncbi:MAG: RNA-binding cell elongation regulator Jag/EloR [Chloroflexota bacterium]|nr:RNA-binding cell elongation regulator Jag/EloR [Chloroflexota bacterium]
MAEKGQAIEATGSDVEAAVAAGLARLGADRDAVKIEVLDDGSRGVFGLRARDARVRLTPELKAPSRPVPVELEPAVLPSAEMAKSAGAKSEAEVAQGALLELLAFLGMDEARVDVRRAEPASDEDDPPLVLDVRGPGTDELVGYRGETLAALQRITRLIVGREMAGRVRLVVDVDGFKERREKSLRRLAQRLAEQTVRTNRTTVLEHMPPHERRIIHITLRDHPQVITQSVGEGDQRKVTIIPRH